MTTPELTRIRAALEAWKKAENMEESCAAGAELDDACDPDVLTSVLAHIDQQAAELAAYDIAVEEYRQQCLDNAAEIARLKRGEFVCQKCGLRKDGEHPATHDF